MIKKIDSEMLRMKVLLIQPIPCFEVEKNLTAAGLSRIPRKQTSIFLQTMIPDLYTVKILMSGTKLLTITESTYNIILFLTKDCEEQVGRSQGL